MTTDPRIDADQRARVYENWVRRSWADCTGSESVLVSEEDGEVFAMWVGMRANVPVVVFPRAHASPVNP